MNLFINHSIENFYEKETQLLHAVMKGQIYRSKTLINQLCASYFDSDTVTKEVVQNYTIALNALLRKTAETTSVPYHSFTHLSAHIHEEISARTNKKAMVSLLKTMTRKYTLLIYNHSMKDYSPLIRKVIIHIDSDLSADLSLKEQAKHLHVNPSYLSSLFRSEVGCTLTEYVTQRRISHAVRLLNSTDLQIQTIAHDCGISDVCYFSRTFKKLIGKTPSEYRESIR